MKTILGIVVCVLAALPLALEIIQDVKSARARKRKHREEMAVMNFWLAQLDTNIKRFDAAMAQGDLAESDRALHAHKLNLRRYERDAMGMK